VENPVIVRLLTVALLLFVATAASAISLTAEQGWVRSGPPGAKMLAGYVRLVNSGDTELRIVEARSTAFEAVEIHRTLEEDGVARMRPVSFVVIPPGQSVTMEPGGLHLMLMRPTKKLIIGDTVVVELVTDDGEALPTAFSLRSMPPDGHDQADHGHHDH
jgi:periplasmic copper chaperone A